jgi:hypothetical protein
MTQIPGLLDQRIRLYAFQNIGANGFDKPVYLFTGEWWGRVDGVADAQTIPAAPQAHAEYRMQGVGTCADYVPIPLQGVLKEGGLLWWIRGVVPNRLRRQQTLALELIKPGEFVDLVEPVQSFADGDQLVDSMGSSA